eukprot:CAMPEP_0201109770 /NCGR_PEP_ID=MMETSP0812-20130820/67641_1 /ASSEMBLY_ACC=CAM_ASM_000668 /TAXON_ID=98059 /ORGANISM="Dinobryon sp., Strain UTEXLB2267" /LENGTH=109 /DNA_ID=CAMNT_0047371893 /DNA_START=106 /DNA_END=435 /DNA_ORIENTATION=+
MSSHLSRLAPPYIYATTTTVAIVISSHIAVAVTVTAARWKSKSLFELPAAVAVGGHLCTHKHRDLCLAITLLQRRLPMSALSHVYKNLSEELCILLAVGHDGDTTSRKR